MVVAGRNPAGVLSGQRLPCHSVFSHPAFRSEPHFSFAFLSRISYTIYYAVTDSRSVLYCMYGGYSAAVRRKSDGNRGAS